MKLEPEDIIGINNQEIERTFAAEDVKNILDGMREMLYIYRKIIDNMFYRI